MYIYIHCIYNYIYTLIISKSITQIYDLGVSAYVLKSWHQVIDHCANSPMCCRYSIVPIREWLKAPSGFVV